MTARSFAMPRFLIAFFLDSISEAPADRNRPFLLNHAAESRVARSGAHDQRRLGL
jgi:hypothetical protein